MIKHAKEITLQNDPNTDLLRPISWNDGHNVPTNLGVGITTPLGNLSVKNNIRLSGSDGAEYNFSQTDIIEIPLDTDMSDWVTFKTISVSSITDIYTMGVVDILCMGHSIGIGNSVIREQWQIDIAANNMVVSQIAGTLTEKGAYTSARGFDDGYGYATGSTWVDVTTATDAAWSTASGTYVEVGSVLTGGTYISRRAFAGFNTSAIPSTDTIYSAELVVDNPTATAGDYTIHVVGGFQGQGPIDTADFDKVGDVSFGQLIFQNAVDESGYKTFTLNSNGLAHINKFGITNLAFIDDFDLTGTPPTINQNEIKLSTKEMEIQYRARLLVNHGDPTTDISVRLLRSGNDVYCQAKQATGATGFTGMMEIKTYLPQGSTLSSTTSAALDWTIS